VGEAAEPQGLAHQAEVLHHHPQLDGDELAHQALELLDGEDQLMPRVVLEVAALGAGEAPQARRPEAGALVDDERPVAVDPERGLPRRA
jgi:hypothetical protein